LPSSASEAVRRRQAAPQEVTEPAGEGIVIEPARFFAQEQEIGRHEHRRERDADGLLKGLLLGQLGFDERNQWLNVDISHRSAECPAGETPQNAIRISQRVFRDDFHPIPADPPVNSPAANRRKYGDGSPAQVSWAGLRLPQSIAKPGPSYVAARLVHRISDSKPYGRISDRIPWLKDSTNSATRVSSAGASK
jgi:hypothetical protein